MSAIAFTAAPVLRAASTSVERRSTNGLAAVATVPRASFARKAATPALTRSAVKASAARPVGFLSNAVTPC